MSKIFGKMPIQNAPQDGHVYNCPQYETLRLQVVMLLLYIEASAIKVGKEEPLQTQRRKPKP